MVTHGSYIFVLYGMVWSFIIRYWLLYFANGVQKSESKAKWQKELVQEFDKKDFFLRNKKTYGNLQYLTYRIIPYY